MNDISVTQKDLYPSSATSLCSMLDDFLAENECTNTTIPKAIIVPHGHYAQSGEIAATAFAQIRTWQSVIKRIILLGHSSHLSFEGMILSSHLVFNTPLGTVQPDSQWMHQALQNPEVNLMDDHMEEEISLQAQIPFLQYCLGEFSLLPMLVGDISSHSAAQVMMNLWGNEETVFVVSANLSHYHRYEEAEARDAVTINAMEQLSTHLTLAQSSGYSAINGLLKTAQHKGLKVTTLARGHNNEYSQGNHLTEGYASLVLQ